MPFRHVLPGKPVTEAGTDVSYASAATVLSYTAPTGKQAICISAMSDGQGATTQTDLVQVVGGNPYIWVDGAANTAWRQPTLYLGLEIGDVIRIEVTNTTIADAGNVMLSVLEAP